MRNYCGTTSELLRNYRGTTAELLRNYTSELLRNYCGMADHPPLNGADRGDWIFASKETSGRSFEPHDLGARGGVLGSRRGAEWKSGEPGESHVTHPPCHQPIILAEELQASSDSIFLRHLRRF